ncbi:MAG: hypothetical protein AAF485_05810 [Chloroflexota bacterium]
MIRLTVLYNLKPYVDEEEFLRWRLTEHQISNNAIKGVIRTDFSRVDTAWPPNSIPPYRFITTLDWPDMDSFQAGFYDPEVQADLEKNMEMLNKPLFLISEILATDTEGGN